MTIKRSLAPHVRTEASVRGMMGDAVIALLFVLVIPAVYYGPRILVMAGITVGTCMLCELLFAMVTRMPLRATDFSAVVTGLILAMLMPPNIDLWVTAAAGMFAILVAKMPFGGTGRAPFNPAASGFVLACVCWPEKVFYYMDPLRQKEALPLLADCNGVVRADSPAALLQRGLRPESTMEDILMGYFPGAVGATAVLVVLACGVYLAVRRTANWDAAAVFLAVCAVWAAVSPRIIGTRRESVFFVLTSGMLVFCAVFMVTEPSTSPRTRLGRCLYGCLAALLTMAMRYFGPCEEGACFALLLVNALSPAIDRTAWKIGRFITPEKARNVFHRLRKEGGKLHET